MQNHAETNIVPKDGFHARPVSTGSELPKEVEAGIASQGRVSSGSPKNRISVAIATYNRAKYLKQTLESLRRQTVPPFEILIQNDGGKDETPEVIKSSGMEIRYFTWENHGPAASRNHLLSQASGNWIMFLDDDDLLMPQALEKFSDELADPRERILYCRYLRIDSEGNELPTRDKFRTLPQGDAAVELFFKNFLLPSGTLLPTGALRAMGTAFPVGQTAEDYDCFLRLSLEIPVQGIDKRLVMRRRHLGNISSGAGAAGVADQIHTLERFLVLAGNRIPNRIRQNRMAEMYARYALALKRDRAGKDSIREAWRNSLAQRFVLKNFIRMLMS